MDYKLELLPVPVTDVDRAKAFYADQLGFVVDVDDSPMEGIRVVQRDPRGDNGPSGQPPDYQEQYRIRPQN